MFFVQPGLLPSSEVPQHGGTLGVYVESYCIVQVQTFCYIMSSIFVISICIIIQDISSPECCSHKHLINVLTSLSPSNMCTAQWYG